MKMRDLKTKSETELRAELIKLKRESQELSTKIKLGQVKTVHTARALRKDIARVLTLLSTQS